MTNSRQTTALAILSLLLACVSLWPCAAQQPTGEDARDRRRTPVVEVFESCKDGVVNVSATSFVERSVFPDFDDIFDRFRFDDDFGLRRRLQQTSVGSGFILHSDGYIVTNAHVVARTGERKVIFADRSEHEAEIVAIDPTRDLAILKIEVSKPLTPLQLGTSSDLMIGETAIAIGNPLGYQHTVTAGVISALDRTLEVSERVRFDGLIQTDASINPGNSGGPLLNVLGELIGVNTAIRTDAQNIGFAIPVDELREALPSLLSIESRYRVRVGLELADAPDRAVGVLIRDVKAGSDAAKAGLRAGDVIQRVGGAPTNTLTDFSISMLEYKPGQSVDVSVKRDDALLITTIDLTELPPPDGIALMRERLGLALERLDAGELAEFGFRADGTFRVVSIESGGPLEAFGMKAGDILVEVNGASPTNNEELGEVIEQIESGDVVPIAYMRGTARRNVSWRIQVQAR